MSLGRLATLFVEVTARGIEAAKSAFMDLGGNVQKLTSEFDDASKAGEAMTGGTAEGAKKTGNAISAAIAEQASATAALVTSATAKIADLSTAAGAGAKGVSADAAKAVGSITAASAAAGQSLLTLEATAGKALAKVEEKAQQAAGSVAEVGTSTVTIEPGQSGLPARPVVAPPPVPLPTPPARPAPTAAGLPPLPGGKPVPPPIYGLKPQDALPLPPVSDQPLLAKTAPPPLKVPTPDRSAVADVAKEVGRLVDQLGQVGKKSEEGKRQSAGLFEGMSIAARGLGAAIAPATSMLSGFVRSGVAASAEGQIMSFQTQELSRQIASLFIPQIRLAQDNLARLVTWFRSLTGEQQRGLRIWALTAASIGVTTAMVPRLTGLVGGLTTSVRGLTVAMTAAMANPLLLAAGTIAASLAAIGVLAAKSSGAGKTGEALADAGSSLGDAFSEAKEAAAELADELAKGANSAAEMLRSALGLAQIKNSKGELMTGVSGIYAALRIEMIKMGVIAKSSGMAGSDFMSGMFMSGEKNPLARFLDKLMGFENPFVKKKAQTPHQELPFPVTAPIEDPSHTWARIAMASRKVGFGGKSSEDRTAEATEATVKKLEDLEKKIGEIKPAVGR